MKNLLFPTLAGQSVPNDGSLSLVEDCSVQNYYIQLQVSVSDVRRAQATVQ